MAESRLVSSPGGMAWEPAHFSSVQLLIRVWLFATLWTAACKASLSITNSWNLLRLMSIELVVMHPTISSSVVPFSSRPQSLPESGPFPMSHLFAPDGQSIRASASASVFLMSIQGWFPLGWTGLILLSKGLSRSPLDFSSTMVQKHQFFSTQPSLWSNSHTCTWPLGKPELWLDGPLSAKWCLCFLIHCLSLS